MNNKEILDALLTPKNDQLTKNVYMKRFGVDFVIRPLSNTEMDSIRQRATRLVGKGKKEFNEDMFNTLTIVKSCVVPNWEDPDLIEGLGAVDALDAVKKRLLFGEYAYLLNECAELNGFGQSDEEQVEEIKN